MNKEQFNEMCFKAVEEAKVIIREMKEGKREKGIVWHPDVLSGKATIREMIGTPEGGQQFLTKATYDLYQGREAIPLLYKDIFTTKSDPNYPKVLVANEMGPISVVFLEHTEGCEVKFGTLEPGKAKLVKFVTWAAGIEYDEDIVEYNETWKVTEIGLGMGEAYNKLLNHSHLGCIIAGTFTNNGVGVGGVSDLTLQKQVQEGVGEIGGTGYIPATPQLIWWDTNLATTLRNALSVLPKGTVLLANPSDQFILEDAIYGSLYADDKTPSVVRRKIRPEAIVYYDGETITVGKKTYTYSGVPAGYVYLLVPKIQFHEYIKHDLRLDSDDGDLSRLILAQIVARSRRAVNCGLSGKYGAVKVELKTGLH